jgi:hypothetical protein
MKPKYVFAYILAHSGGIFMKVHVLYHTHSLNINLVAVGL